MSFTILGEKDAARPPRPLLLVTLVATDGDTLYLSTASALGGPPVYLGNTYQTRLISQNLEAIQGMSPYGIDVVPKMTLEIADADASMWANHLKPHGWRGAAVTATLILWDLPTNAYSTDAITWSFIGGGHKYSRAAGTISLTCTSRANFQRVKVPAVPISRLCPWVFPTTAAQRLSAQTDMTSIYYQCGYAPDQGGTGNTTTANLTNPDGSPLTDASGIYVTCDKTRSCGNRTTSLTQGCMARQGNYGGNPVAAGSKTVSDGDITRDQAGRATGRFGGITWRPSQQKVEGRQYTTGTWVTLFNQANDAIFGGYWNQVYGIQAVAAKVVNTSVAPNITLGEAVLCFAPNGAVLVDISLGFSVVINGVSIPQNNPNDPNFSWYWINAGGRNGAVSPAPTYDGSGDCYGSLAAIGFTLPYELAGPGQTPDVKVLVGAPPIATYELVSGVPTVFYRAAWCNPVWQFLDLMLYGNYTFDQGDLMKLIAAASFCDANINYINNNGVADTHSRFRSMFTLDGDHPQTLAQVITALRNNCGMMFAPNTFSGLFGVFIEGTLADQQNAPVAGSNYNTPVSSQTADGTMTNGYLAYLFTEADIKWTSLQFGTRDLEELPDEVSISFQDEHNQWQTDSMTITDPDGYVDAGNQEVDDQTPVLGICNFDQGQRRGNTILSKDLRGNDRDDAKGTDEIEFVTTMKALHLAAQPGLICGLSDQLLGW